MPSVEFNPLDLINELDALCWQCSSRLPPQRDFIADDSDPKVCGICHGIGYQLNDSGRELLAFLERWKGRKP
jgi:hypothetical protein